MLYLIFGGAACGKSAYAEALAASLPGPKYYLATMDPAEPGAAAKIARHRALRQGKGFATLEQPRNMAALTPDREGVVLLECLTTLAANECFGPAGFENATQRITEGVLSLAAGCRHLVVVAGDLTRDGETWPDLTGRYLDVLAECQRRLAAAADHVAEVCCGIPIPLKGELPK